MLFTSNSGVVPGSGVGPAAIHVWGCHHLRSSMFYGLILSTMFIASLAAARPAKAATNPPSPFTRECANLPFDPPGRRAAGEPGQTNRHEIINNLVGIGCG
jgi:hypothetical protein